MDQQLPVAAYPCPVDAAWATQWHMSAHLLSGCLSTSPLAVHRLLSLLTGVTAAAESVILEQLGLL